MDKLALIYRVPTPRTIYGMFSKEMCGCTSVLDVGCGENSILLRLGINHKEISGLDIWEEYVKKNKNDMRYKEYLKIDVIKADFPKKSFDVVLLADVIEHIPKEEVLNSNLFDKLSGWARKKVVIMTPSGFVGNDSYDGNPYLYHKSGWTAKELREFGFKVRSTFRVRRKKYWKIMGLEFVWTLFAVKDCGKE